MIETNLPDFSLPRGQADVLLFVFPNIVPDPDLPDPEEEKDSHLPNDRDVADYLALAREPDPEEETVGDDPETLCDSLITDNLIARNLRRLLKKGGVCVRADYANAPRNELTKLVRQRLAFQEGSLQDPVNGFRQNSTLNWSDPPTTGPRFWRMSINRPGIKPTKMAVTFSRHW